MRRHRALLSDHQSGGHADPGMERWLLTYADMITLLLALFIVLFAVSTINQKKFESLALGLKQTFDPNPGVLPAGNGILSHSSLTPTAGANLAQGIDGIAKTQMPAAAVARTSKAVTSNLATIQRQINQALVAKHLNQDVSSSIEMRGLVVQILADKVFFATDSADLGTLGSEIVDTVAAVLSRYPNSIEVEGYTDDAPITGGPYTSNEELSAVRAVNVVLRLYRHDGIAHDRLAAVGFGQTHPQVPNTSPANMALNRRIDVVVLAPGKVQP